MNPLDIAQHVASQPRFERGVGTGNQQPMGAATAQNAQIAATPSPAAPPGAAPPPSPSGQAGGPQAPLNEGPGMAGFLGPELAKSVLGNTTRPHEPIGTGMTAAGNPRPSDTLIDWLPIIGDAANTAGSPAQIQQVFQTLTHLAAQANLT